MFKLFVFVALLAFAAAAPKHRVLAAYSEPLISAGYAAPYSAYSAYSAPLAYPGYEGYYAGYTHPHAYSSPYAYHF